MTYKEITLGKKTAKIPLIQGGMGIGVSLSNLAGAVAKEGGIGIISSAQIGFMEEDFDKNPCEANLRAIKKEFDKARAISPDGIIGFNIMVALRDYEKQVKAALEAGADIIISGAGLPTDLPKLAAGYDVALAPIVSTEKSASVILKFWDKKYQRMPEIVVIEGPKAGGHLGFDKEQLEQFTTEVYEEEIKNIIKVVNTYEEKYNKKIYVFVAGGISTAKDVERALELGADGVQVATRFIATKECDASDAYKQAYVDAKEEDIVLVSSPVGMPGRAIKNDFTNKVANNEKIPHSPCHGCIKKCNPSDIPYCITDKLVMAAKGDIKEGLLFCGADAAKITKIETVSQVIASLFV